MPINKNHEFEDLDGVKCSIVERNASKERVEFLKNLLAFNRYEVIVVPSPPPKVAPAPKPIGAAPSATPYTEVPVTQPASALPATTPLPVPETPAAPMPETFTVGVTNVLFNPTNAVFGRLLRTPDGHVVTLAYWEQKETVANDEVPYFGRI